MRKYIFTAVFLIIGFIDLYAQPVIMQQKCFGGSLFEQPFGEVKTHDGGLLIGGHSLSNDFDIPSNYGDYDWWIIRLDSNGNKMWSRSYGGSLYDKCRYVNENSDGTICAFGSVNSNDSDVVGNHGHNDLWMIKLDSAGNFIWKRCYGGTKDDAGRQVYENLDGNYVGVSYLYSKNGDVSANYGDYDAWIFEVDKDSGNIIWEKNYGGSLEDRVRTIYQWPDSNYVFVGNTFSTDSDLTGTINQGGEDLWAAKIDKHGNLIWSVQYGSAGMDRAYYLVPDKDGNVLVCGRDSTGGIVSNNHGDADVWILKLDYATGSLIWEKSFGGSKEDTGFRIDPTADNGYLVSATLKSSDGDSPGYKGAADYWLIKLDSARNIQWSKNYGGPQFDHLYDAFENPDSTYWMIGFTNSDSLPGSDVTGVHGQFDLWVVKAGWCDSTGTINASGALQFCPGNSVDLTAPEGETYLWSNGATLQSIQVALPGTYTVTVTKWNNYCIKNCTPVTVSFLPIPAIPVISVNGNQLTSTSAVNYQWYFNGNLLPGDTLQTLNAMQAGSYYVMVFDSNGCSNTSAAVIMTVGLNEVLSQNGFQVYPNPVAQNQFTVKNEKLNSVNCIIELFDLTGQKLFSTSKTFQSNSTKLIELNSVSKGIYFLQIISEGDVVFNQKLIIE